MNIITASFHGQSIEIINCENQPFVPMKSIVESMGLGWRAQFDKIKESAARWGMREILIPTKSGIQSMICLPLRKLMGWLMTIHPNKIPNLQTRETVIRYQNECDDVLWKYWSEGIAENPRSKATPKTKKMIEGCLTLEQQDAIKALVACRTEVLPKEKKGKAVITLWSSIKSKYGLAKEQTYKDIPAEQFEQVLSLVARVPLEGELLPKESLPSPAQEISADAALDRLTRDAFLTSKQLHDGIMIFSEKLKTRAINNAERVMQLEDRIRLA